MTKTKATEKLSVKRARAQDERKGVEFCLKVRGKEGGSIAEVP